MRLRLRAVSSPAQASPRRTVRAPVTMLFRIPARRDTATTSDGDFIAKTGTLTFAPGETTKTITIEVKGDSKREANETFYLDLFGPGAPGSRRVGIHQESGHRHDPERRLNATVAKAGEAVCSGASLTGPALPRRMFALFRRLLWRYT